MSNVIGAIIKCNGLENHFCVHFKHGVSSIANLIKVHCFGLSSHIYFFSKSFSLLYRVISFLNTFLYFDIFVYILISLRFNFPK